MSCAIKVSVAIPAYNAERTLERTLRSVCAQTLREIEILVVNNGSSDGTGELARRLAAEDGRIKVFDVYPNVGGYGARLYAWTRATGKYLATVDADDVIEPDMYERMVAIAEKESLDVVECDWIYGIDSPSPETMLPDLFLSREEVLEKVVCPTFVSVGKSAYTWNKLYKNQYDFTSWEDGDFGSYEDLIHNLQLFKSVTRYGHIHAQFYHYMPSDASVTRNFSLRRLDQFSAAIAAKWRLVSAYGVASDSPVLDLWVLNDALNAMKSAVVCNTDIPRTEVLRKVLQMEGVKGSIVRLKARNDKSSIFRFMRIASQMPVPLLLIAFRLTLFARKLKCYFRV